MNVDVRKVTIEPLVDEEGPQRVFFRKKTLPILNFDGSDVWFEPLVDEEGLFQVFFFLFCTKWCDASYFPFPKRGANVKKTEKREDAPQGWGNGNSSSADIQ